MRSNCIILYALLALALPSGGAPAAAQDRPGPADPKRQADERAIDQLTKDMIGAFDSGDAVAIAARWTDDGEFRHNDDEPVRGRADIRKGYEEFFKSLQGKSKLEIQSDSLRFPSADMAVKETTLRLKDDDGQVVASGRQDAILIREGGKWKIALIQERDRDVGLDARLKDLEWLIGAWRAVAGERQVSVSYEWDKNQAFIRGSFTVKEGSTVIDSGTEIIGKDNVRGVIRSWLFQSDGGFGTGAWTHEGKTWRIHVDGIKADGNKLNGTVVYTRIDPNTFTWQAVNLDLEGDGVDDTAPIKVARQPSPAK